MKVLLEKWLYIADPKICCVPRTYVEEHAQEFNSVEEAVQALEKARTVRPFKDAQIVDDFV